MAGCSQLDVEVGRTIASSVEVATRNDRAELPAAARVGCERAAEVKAFEVITATRVGLPDLHLGACERLAAGRANHPGDHELLSGLVGIGQHRTVRCSRLVERTF